MTMLIPNIAVNPEALRGAGVLIKALRERLQLLHCGFKIYDVVASASR